MKIITLNTHSLIEKQYEEKLQEFVKVIQAEEPDVFALQEVNQTAEEICYPYNKLKGFTPCTDCDTVIRIDNHAARLAELLAEKGLFYYWIWIPIKLGYDKYDEGMALFSKLEIIETHQFYTSKVQDYNNWKTRKALGIKTLDAGGSWFYCIHMGWWDDKDEPFQSQWDVIEKTIAEKKGHVWLLGDFNSPAHISGEGYDYIRTHGWKDSYISAKEKDSGITVGNVIDGWRDSTVDEAGMRIDIIWSKEEEAVKTSDVICNGKNHPIVSDHYGVMITVECEEKYE